MSRIKIRRVRTTNSEFSVSHKSKESVIDLRQIEKPFEHPTIEMSLVDIQVLLEIDDSLSRREEHIERTKHTRPTVQMVAVKT